MLSFGTTSIRFITILKLNDLFILEMEMFSIENVLRRLCDDSVMNSSRSILKLKTIYSAMFALWFMSPLEKNSITNESALNDVSMVSDASRKLFPKYFEHRWKGTAQIWLKLYSYLFPQHKCSTKNGLWPENELAQRKKKSHVLLLPCVKLFSKLFWKQCLSSILAFRSSVINYWHQSLLSA